MKRVGATIGSAALLMVMSVAGPAHADPTGPLPGPTPVPAPPDPAGPPADAADPQIEVGSPDTGDPVKDACDQFAQAADLGATSYEAFADASEGPGNDVNYGDPEVERTSLITRAALRSAAGIARDAANIPGLPAEVADPIRSWSAHATKLIFVLSLHGSRDSMNSAVSQVNDDYQNAHQACAMTMAHPG